jgi:hypothetical protein
LRDHDEKPGKRGIIAYSRLPEQLSVASRYSTFPYMTAVFCYDTSAGATGKVVGIDILPGLNNAMLN